MKFASVLIFAFLSQSIFAFASVECNWETPNGSNLLSLKSSPDKSKATTYETTLSKNDKGKTIVTTEQLIDLMRNSDDLSSALSRTTGVNASQAEELINKYGSPNIYVYYNSGDNVVIALNTIDPGQSEVFSNFYATNSMEYRVPAKCKVKQ